MGDRGGAEGDAGENPALSRSGTHTGDSKS